MPLCEQTARSKNPHKNRTKPRRKARSGWGGLANLLPPAKLRDRVAEIQGRNNTIRNWNSGHQRPALSAGDPCPAELVKFRDRYSYGHVAETCHPEPLLAKDLRRMYRT